MRVLGINYFGHDSSAAIVVDGQVIAAAEEERFTRKKHEKSFPHRAIEFCLKTAGIQKNEIDRIAFSMIPMEVIRDGVLKYSLEYFPESLPLLNSKLQLIGYYTDYEKHVKTELQWDKPIDFLRHHECHWASSYYNSGFKESCLMSFDGSGEHQTGLIGYARDNQFHILQDTRLPHTLGYLYDGTSVYLGFDNVSGPGKVMGLSSYGNPEKWINEFRKIVLLDEETGTFKLDLSYFEFHKRRDVWISNKFIETFGPKRPLGHMPIDQHYMDVAAALQLRVEEVGIHVAKHLVKKTGIKNICIAGGTALNCVMNGRILRESGVQEIFVQPAANDAGTSIGAALLCYYRANPQVKTNKKLDNTYLGPSYTTAEVQTALTEFSQDIVIEQPSNVSEIAARLLADGKILGWFQGRMEFGPRALGNRSILSAPYPASRKDEINDRVKHREYFRPFAPAIRLEEVGEYFDSNYESPYMLLVSNVLPDKKDVIPAVTHVDHTGRVQTVRKDQNPRFYDLIGAFGKLTGVKVILNTSFNDKGEPLVCSPTDAIRCFLKTEIDVLVIDQFVITKKKRA